MAVGIVDFGSYVPYTMVQRQAVVAAWDMGAAAAGLQGARAVAYYDEDTVTMAVEAVLNCLPERGRSNTVDGLFFASTTAPYSEKSSAALVATACDLAAVRRTSDFANSLRASTSALQSALDAVTAGSLERVVVAAADMRSAPPGSIREATSGDGAAALLVGSGQEVVAEVVSTAHVTQALHHEWRLQGDRTSSTDEEAYGVAKGYLTMSAEALKRLVDGAGISPEEITQVIAYAADGRSYGALSKKLPAPLNREPLLATVGCLGTASVILQLALALESASPGDLLAVIGYGDGADAFLVRVTEAIRGRTRRRGVLDWLADRAELPSYLMSLYFRGMIQDRPLWDRTAEPWTAVPLLQREQRELLSFNALRCGECGSVWWPRRAICYECGAQESFEWISLKRRGTVASVVAEWAAPGPVVPNGVAVVDQVDGARITTSLCDCDPETVRPGDEVEFCLRVLHQAKHMIHYAWKVRPVRGARRIEGGRSSQ